MIMRQMTAQNINLEYKYDGRHVESPMYDMPSQADHAEPHCKAYQEQPQACSWKVFHVRWEDGAIRSLIHQGWGYRGGDAVANEDDDEEAGETLLDGNEEDALRPSSK